MEMIEETSAKETESNGIEDIWEPESVETVFGDPETVVVFFGDGEGRSIGEVWAVEEDEENTDLVSEGDWHMC